MKIDIFKELIITNITNITNIFRYSEMQRHQNLFSSGWNAIYLNYVEFTYILNYSQQQSTNNKLTIGFLKFHWKIQN